MLQRFGAAAAWYAPSALVILGLAVLWQVAAGEVDASFDLYTSYAIWEKVLGKGQVGNLLWADYGLPIYGHTYFVNTETVTQNPKLIGWIEPELMAKTLEITFANAKPDKPVKFEDVYTNAFSSRIKPLK